MESNNHQTQTPIETMKMIALPNGSFVRSDAITAVSVLPEDASEAFNYHFPNRVVVHHNGSKEVVTMESLDKAKELAAEISRQCRGEEPSGIGLYPFDLQRALDGEKVVTRDGLSVTNLMPTGGGQVSGSIAFAYYTWDITGVYGDGKKYPHLQLFMFTDGGNGGSK